MIKSNVCVCVCRGVGGWGGGVGCLQAAMQKAQQNVRAFIGVVIALWGRWPVPPSPRG